MSAPAVERPYTLIAELTYRCPLQCGYCSNPIALDAHPDALDAAAWARALREAAELGVVQVHLTGGEPLLRSDLEAIVAAARAEQLYVQLVTSGIPLTLDRLRALRDAGLDAVQLSLQDADAGAADRMAGARAFARKLEAATWARGLGLPLTLNAVLHRENIDRTSAIIDLAAALGADRLELANVQYLGWALENRRALLPSRAQLERARAEAQRARARFGSRMEIVFVLADYLAGVPRACMDGWGRRFLVISPDGLVLPCHQAHTLHGLTFERVGARALSAIWRDSRGLNAYRGEAWMQEPCRSCERRALDFGGCRCQAFHLTGDAAATDPACALAPAHAQLHAFAEQGAPDRVIAPRRLSRGRMTR